MPIPSSSTKLTRDALLTLKPADQTASSVATTSPPQPMANGNVVGKPVVGSDTKRVSSPMTSTTAIGKSPSPEKPKLVAVKEKFRFENVQDALDKLKELFSVIDEDEIESIFVNWYACLLISLYVFVKCIPLSFIFSNF
jgi:hypothetical protein